MAIGAVALLAAGTVQSSSARADEVIDYDVGGGAAAIQVDVSAQNYELFPPLIDADLIRYRNAVSAVVLGKNGGNKTKYVANQRVGSLLRVSAASVNIKGNRQGTPFAEATTSLTGITLQGSPIRAISTYCRWDKNGAPFGWTRVTDASGATYEPAPNTEVPIPGLGTLTLNEQYIDRVLVETGGPTGGGVAVQEVIYINGAHLRIAGEYGSDDVAADVLLGFTSCDPVKLPNLGGLALISTPT